MFTMYDDVNLSLIPAMPHAVGCYRNGLFANENEARHRFPHARILPISVTGWVACDAYDIERGDYSPGDVPRLYQIAHDAGIWRPCFYAQLSGIMAEVRAELRPHIKTRDDVRLWVAYYNGQTDLPAEYDAHQFTSSALGRSLDESICRDTFFPPVSHPSSNLHKPSPVNDKLMRAVVAFDPDEHTWSAHGIGAGVEHE